MLSLNQAASLEDRIKSYAIHLGFSRCGITSADPPPHHEEYRRWIDQQMCGEMAYLERQEPKRSDLSHVMPDVKSLIVVALNYFTGDQHETSQEGNVARYARFDDYHETMWARLRDLLSYITSQQPAASGMVYCDTGPITERDYAMRAGLGWIGKHTNLINRRLGNWFFLGEILLNIALSPDTAEQQHCGTCTKCIPACPTGAIVAPYKLDARRCISYLTIELKGSIPVDLRPLIGDKIYGCDDCLAVCPWNKFAVKNFDPVVQPDSDLSAPDLRLLLKLEDTEFRKRFSNSPILRTKRRGFLRNVCVALGNTAGVDVLPDLEIAKHDQEPLIREHAEWAINEINRRVGSS